MLPKKIQIIDDDPDLVLGIGIRLRSAGYLVVIAQDATMAQTIANREQPDLILLDLGLPGGDGYTVLERLRANFNTALAPVIVISARDHSEADRALSSGAFAFFQKPVENDVLLQAIEAALS